MKTILIATTKNKLRQQKLLIKNWLWSYILAVGSVLVGAVGIVIGWKPLLAAIHPHADMVHALAAVVLVLFFVVKKQPCLLVNPATVHYCDHHQLQMMLKLVVLRRMLVFAFVGIALVAIVQPLLYGLYFLQFWSLCGVWLLLFWEKWHRSVVLWRLYGLLLLAVVLFYFQLSIIGGLCNLTILIIQSKQFMVLDKARYLEAMVFLSGTEAAGARKDWGKIIAYAEANAVKDHYVVGYQACRRVHPLFAKATLDMLRVNRPALVIAGLLACAAVLALTTNIVAPNGVWAFVICWTFVLNFLASQSVEVMVKMRGKHNTGLYLPYPMSMLARCYAVWPILQMMLLQLVAVLLTPVPLLAALVMGLLYGLVIYLWHGLRLYRPHWRQIIQLVASSLLAAISGWLVIFL